MVVFLKTTVSSWGFSETTDIVRDENGKPLDGSFNEKKRVTREDDYSYFLPSASFKWTLYDDYVIRISAAQAITRPELSRLKPGQSVSSSGPLLEDNHISLANPGLKPYTADMFDLGAAWYYSETGMVSAGFYFKELEGFHKNRAW